MLHRIRLDGARHGRGIVQLLRDRAAQVLHGRRRRRGDETFAHRRFRQHLAQKIRERIARRNVEGNLSTHVPDRLMPHDPPVVVHEDQPCAIEIERMPTLLQRVDIHEHDRTAFLQVPLPPRIGDALRLDLSLLGILVQGMAIFARLTGVGGSERQRLAWPKLVYAHVARAHIFIDTLSGERRHTGGRHQKHPASS